MDILNNVALTISEFQKEQERQARQKYRHEKFKMMQAQCARDILNKSQTKS